VFSPKAVALHVEKTLCFFVSFPEAQIPFEEVQILQLVNNPG
jgi:hypothetical protein